MNTPALKKEWFLSAQGTDCPEDVEEVISNLWRTYGLGNDNYIIQIDVNTLQIMDDEGYKVEQFFWGETEKEQKGWVETPASLQPLIKYLKDKGIKPDENVILHWWW